MEAGVDLRERQLRAARNQSLFREINERISKLNTEFERSLPTGECEWLCECWQESCVERVVLSLDEYERVRAVGTRFLVAPTHVDPLVERAVEQTNRYWTVEKIEAGAAVAREADPRR